MRELNRSHRKKDKPTDVLSFPSVLPGDYPELASDEVKYPLGDIVISIDTAITQAERYRWNLQSELLRLLIHGILHLLGYDHEKVSPAVANKMRRLEKTLFLRHRDSAPLLISGRASPRSTRR
jgi:probable rRNA maturation factor